MMRLFLLYAILIFAKRAPKMITDLLNIKSEGMGLKGLNIKNKMGEAALVGDKVKKGMLYAEGKTKGAMGGFASGFFNTKGSLAEKLAGGLKGSITGSKTAGKEAVIKGDTKGLMKKGYSDVKPLARGGKPTFWDRTKAAVSGVANDFAQKHNLVGFTSLEKANLDDYEKLKKKLTDMYGTKKAHEMLLSLGKIDFANGSRYDAARSKLKGWTDAYNTHDDPSLPLRNADQRYIKQNILDARGKLYDKLAAYDSQIESIQQSINPLTQQLIVQKTTANAQLDALNTQVSATQSELDGVDRRLITGELNSQQADDLKAALTEKLNSLQSQSATLNAQVTAYERQINSDTNYQQAMSIINSINQNKDEEFKKAVDKGLFEENGASGIDVGVKGIDVRTNGNADISKLYAVLSDEKVKNSKALDGVTKEIEESGKEPEPPSKSE